MLFIITLLAIGFGLVVLIGAPYLPTLKTQQKEALKLLNLKKGQTVLDLGSGDGRFLLEAARNGYKAIGIEANPILVFVSYFITFKYRKNVTIKWGNFWRGKLPEVDGIYVFLHTRFMTKLHNKITQDYNGKKINVVSYAFKITEKKPDKIKDGLILYKY